MGLIDVIGGRPTYFDSNIFIYALEGEPVFAPILADLFEDIDHEGLRVTTSELTLAEVLVIPLRKGDKEKIVEYRWHLRSRNHFSVVPISRQIIEEAARLRAETTLKLPDAIHAATAGANGCEVFLTNDGRIKAIPGLEVIQLSDVA